MFWHYIRKTFGDDIWLAANVKSVLLLSTRVLLQPLRLALNKSDWESVALTERCGERCTLLFIQFLGTVQHFFYRSGDYGVFLFSDSYVTTLASFQAFLLGSCSEYVS